MASVLSLLVHAGDMYSNGQGVKEDLEEAFKCYKRATELGKH